MRGALVARWCLAHAGAASWKHRCADPGARLRGVAVRPQGAVERAGIMAAGVPLRMRTRRSPRDKAPMAMRLHAGNSGRAAE